MILIQQVNIYPHKPKEKQPLLNARRALYALVVIMVAVLMVSAALKWQRAGFSNELNRLEQANTPLKLQVEGLTTALGQRSANPALTEQVQLLQHRQRLQARVIDEVMSITPGQQVGFSPVLRGLAQVQIAGVWLETVQIDRSYENIVLVGRTQSPELVPVYIEALHQTGILSGVQFKGLQVEAVNKGLEPYRFRLSSRMDGEETG